jgi:hypothetical protein
VLHATPAESVVLLVCVGYDVLFGVAQTVLCCLEWHKLCCAVWRGTNCVVLFGVAQTVLCCLE